MSKGTKRPRKKQWQEVVVLLERAFTDSPGQKDRAEQYQMLRRASEDRREELLAYLRESGLEGDAEISEPTAFNMLFVKGTPDAIERIKQAPGVARVLPAGGKLKIDLLA